MNKPLLTALLIGGTGLIGTVVGYLGGASPASSDDSIGSSDKAPSKTTRVAANSGPVPQFHRDPSSVDQEFVDWMRTASEDEMRKMVLAQLDGKYTRLNFRAAVLLRELFRRNPQDTFEFFRSSHQPRSSILMMGLFEVWSSINPLESTETLVDHIVQERTSDLSFPARFCFQALAREDLQTALDLAERLSKVGRGQDYAYAGLLAGYAGTAPADMEAVMALVAERGIDPSSAVGPWAEADPERATAWVHRHGDNRPKAASALARSISIHDPRKGLEFYREFDLLTDTRFGSFHAGSALSKWMETDYNAGLTWMANNIDATQRNAVLKSTFRSLQRTHPELVINQILAGDPAASRHGSLSEAIRSFGRTGSKDDVLRLIETAPTEKKQEVRDALMEIGYTPASEEYLARVLSTLDESSGISTNTAVHRVLQRQPEKLPGMLAQVPPEHRAYFLDKFSYDISSSDPNVLLNTIAQWDDPSIYAERAPQSAISQIALSNPEKAMTTVEAIPEGPGRSVAVETLLANLMPDDPGTALGWLETQRGTGIPDDRYQKLLVEFRRSHPMEAERIDAMLERAKNPETE